MFFQKIKDLFQKTKIGFQRMGAESLPYTSAEKKYGNLGEVAVYDDLKELLPGSTVLRSVCLDPIQAKNEIDYLVIYRNKVFCIELKTWEGRVYQSGDTFYKDKESSGGETYTKELKSPFKQIRRNIYQIKQLFPNIWFEPVVLFQNCESVRVTEDNAVWFDSIEKMTQYIENFGKANKPDSIHKMLEQLVTYDTLYATSFFGKEEECIIYEDSLFFDDGTKSVSKKDIQEIHIEHHFSYDLLYIQLNDHSVIKIENESKTIRYRQNGNDYSVGLNKIDYIRISSKNNM